MQINPEFVVMHPTPTEKHVAVITIKVFGAILLRYKVVPKKDGSGWFAAPPSIKLDDSYISAFTLDSNSQNEILASYVHGIIKEKFGNGSAPSHPMPPDCQMPDVGECPF